MFGGDIRAVREFAALMGADGHAAWLEADVEAAVAGWTRYAQIKRAGKTGRRPLADILIGAFACRFSGLVTRNPDHFRPFFPNLRVLVPRATA